MIFMQKRLGCTGPERLDEVAVYDARELIRDGVKAEIRLDGQSYILRITRAGKLILTK